MISLLVIACNEEARLRACVESARPAVDQVVIVVQNSHDGTLALARELADVVVEDGCYGHPAPSRAKGLAACAGEWVLTLDADETLTPWAAARLRSWCESGDYYRLRRHTTAGGHTLEDACHGRLFRKDKVVAPVGLLDIHSTCRPLPDVSAIDIDAAVCIDHAKTWDEQKEDDRRYGRLQAGATYKDVEGWFDFEDVYRAAVARAADGDEFVEVGAYKGRSAIYLASLIRDSGKRVALTAVDTWGGSLGDPSRRAAEELRARGSSLYATFLDNVAACGVAAYLTPLRMPSLEAAPRFEDRSLSLVYIDADHGYESVRADIAAWLPKVRPGGVIAGHDFNMPGVHRAVREAFGDRAAWVGVSSWVVRA